MTAAIIILGGNQAVHSGNPQPCAGCWKTFPHVVGDEASRSQFWTLWPHWWETSQSLCYASVLITNKAREPPLLMELHEGKMLTSGVKQRELSSDRLKTAFELTRFHSLSYRRLDRESSAPLCIVCCLWSRYGIAPCQCTSWVPCCYWTLDLLDTVQGHSLPHTNPLCSLRRPCRSTGSCYRSSWGTWKRRECSGCSLHTAQLRK